MFVRTNRSIFITCSGENPYSLILVLCLVMYPYTISSAVSVVGIHGYMFITSRLAVKACGGRLGLDLILSLSSLVLFSLNLSKGVIWTSILDTSISSFSMALPVTGWTGRILVSGKLAL